MRMRNLIPARIRHHVRLWKFTLLNLFKIARFLRTSGSDQKEKVTKVTSVPVITVSELQERLQYNDMLVLDVRGTRDFEDVHIAGSMHIEFAEVLERINEIPRDKNIAVICYGGGASEYVTQLLLERGFPSVVNIEGGILRWALDVDNDLLELF